MNYVFKRSVTRTLSLSVYITRSIAPVQSPSWPGVNKFSHVLLSDNISYFQTWFMLGISEVFKWDDTGPPQLWTFKRFCVKMKCLHNWCYIWCLQQKQLYFFHPKTIYMYCYVSIESFSWGFSYTNFRPNLPANQFQPSFLSQLDR